MSPLMETMTEHKLKKNMRTDVTEVNFSNYLLKIGEGREEHHKNIGENIIKIPDEYLVTSLPLLIESVFPDLEYGCGDSSNLMGGTIYTPLNKDMSAINQNCISTFPGNSKEYLSADSILEDDHKGAIPVEFLNDLTPSGMSLNPL